MEKKKEVLAKVLIILSFRQDLSRNPEKDLMDSRLNASRMTNKDICKRL